MIEVYLTKQDGTKQMLTGNIGQTLLELAWENNLEVEGTCGGVMSCSTCHVIIERSWLNKIEPPSKEEVGLLELTWGVTSGSRLGCQVKLTEPLNGASIRFPGIEEC
jgi:ferredoxin